MATPGCVAAKDYRSLFGFTYRQAQEAGWRVRKGKNTATVIKYGTFDKEDPETGDGKSIGYTKGHLDFSLSSAVL